MSLFKKLRQRLRELKAEKFDDAPHSGTSALGPPELAPREAQLQCSRAFRLDFCEPGSMAFDERAQLLAVAGKGLGIITLYGAYHGRSFSFGLPAGAEVGQLCFVPTQGLLVVSDSPGTAVYVFDVGQQCTLKGTLRFAEYDIATCSDGKFCVTDLLPSRCSPLVFCLCGNTGQICILDTKSMALSAHLLRGGGPVRQGLVHCEDGSLLLLLSPSSGAVLQLDALSNRIMLSYSPPVDQEVASLSMDVTPDGKFLLAGTRSGHLLAWRLILERKKGNPPLQRHCLLAAVGVAGEPLTGVQCTWKNVNTKEYFLICASPSLGVAEVVLRKTKDSLELHRVTPVLSPEGPVTQLLALTCSSAGPSCGTEDQRPVWCVAVLSHGGSCNVHCWEPRAASVALDPLQE
eukprot:RCo055718